MDKDYNVDDILSEIKSRKSRQKSGQPPQREPEGDGGFQFAPGTFDDPGVTPSQRDDAFQFDLPDNAPPSHMEEGQNPLEFTGHVRSIKDKAKLRHGTPGAPTGRPTRDIPVSRQSGGEEPAPQVTRVDFGAFRAADGDDQHTRVLPKFSTGKVDNLGEKGAIGAAAESFADQGYYEEDIPEDNLPEHSAIDFSEYNSVKDRRDVATDIARVKLWLFIRAAATAVLAALLFYFTMAGYYVMPIPSAMEPVGDTIRTYMIVNTVITVLVALVNSSAIGGGLLSLFKMRANSDTLVSLALLVAIVQQVICIVNIDVVDPTKLNIYFCVAAIAMLFNALGKMTMINRIQLNFRIVGSERKRKALVAVDNDDFCREFIPEAVRRPTIAYSVESGFFSDFLGLSYSDKYDVGINRAVAPVCLVGSLLVAVVSYLLAGDILASVSAMTAVLCIAATFSSTFIENIPLGKLAKKLHPLGGMVSGNKAVEDFCDTEAVVLTENDLFPEGNVRLRGIKAFSQARIDEAIVDAASVLCAQDGALAPVFLQMIGGNKKLLKKVDNIVYENGMGVSAWVDSRRVLIGNRQLMMNHGITLPAAAAKAAQITDPENGEMLYLSNSGEVSAQFAVSYHIDEDLAVQLDQLAAHEKMLIVYTCDANVTPHRLWELYGYPEELIRVMPAERHKQYRTMIQPRETAVAEIVYTGRASALVGSIIACMNARSSILAATMVQLIQIIVGYGLIAFMAFMGSIETLKITYLCVYQLFWFAAIFLVQKSKQP